MVKAYVVELQERVDALSARLAEVLSEIDDHHSEYCDQMRGPIGEQWRERDKPCTCWVGDVMRKADSASADIKPQYSEQFKRRVAEELEGFGDVVRARTAADQPEAAGK